ncbi:hypothetical protein LCGC14_3061130 [marine sediment metagenome]|uniref:Uncharacterized protein n=1 Tax=marine sediment metagenome TaxID=412755 RepID=A0A0F8WIS6_9ZZZZ
MPAMKNDDLALPLLLIGAAVLVTALALPGFLRLFRPFRESLQGEPRSPVLSEVEGSGAR